MTVFLSLLGLYWKQILAVAGGLISFLVLNYYKGRSAYLETREQERQVNEKIEQKHDWVDKIAEAEKNKIEQAKTPEDFQKEWDGEPFGKGDHY